MELPKKVVLITGCCGLIGSAVVRRLARRFTVVGFDRAEAPHSATAAEYLDVELDSAESLQDRLQLLRERHGSYISSVLHLADYQEVADNPGPRSAAITRWHTECLLNALQGFRIDQFVFLSTMLVHSPCEPGEAIHENSAFRSPSLQGDWAAKTEKLIRSEHGDIPIVLLRIASVYDDRAHSTFLAHQIQRIYERRVSGHVYPGDTDRGRAFVHLADLVEAIRCCVERRSQLPEELALLIGEPSTVSYDELQRILGRLIHHEVWETFQIPKTIARTGAWLEEKVLHRDGPSITPDMIACADEHYALNIERAKSLLGWRPTHTLTATLPDMVEALCSSPLQWYAVNHLPAPRKGRLKPRSSTFSPKSTMPVLR